MVFLLVTLVTGGVGFIGANIVHSLLKRGEDVVSLDVSAPDGYVRKFLEGFSAELQFIQGDIRDRNFVKNVINTQAIQETVHAAAITANGPEAEQQLAPNVVEVNVMGTVNLLEAAKSAEVRRIVYLSSSGLYPATEDAEKPVPEDILLRIKGLYSVTKQACEHICRRYSELYNMDIVMTRIAAQYGPVEQSTHARQRMSYIYDLVELARKKTPIRISSEKMPKDWTYAGDTADGIVAMLKANTLNHDMYNLSIGRNFEQLEVVEALKQHIPTLTYEISETPNISRSLVSRGPLDISRVQEDFKYTPIYDIQTGLGAYLDWLQRRDA